MLKENRTGQSEKDVQKVALVTGAGRGICLLYTSDAADD